MASYSDTKSVTATLAAATVDTVTLTIPYNIVTVINESSAGVISFSVNGVTPTAGGNSFFEVAPNATLTVPNSARIQGESSNVNGVVTPVRFDNTLTTISGSPTVLDAAVVSSDVGRRIEGSPNIPVPAYVGTVSNGVSFTLSSSPTANVPIAAVATGATTATLSAVQVTASGASFTRGVDPGNVFSYVAIGTFPSTPFVNLISAGTPSYTVIGG